MADEPDQSALSEKDLLQRLARDMREIRLGLQTVINYIIEAESEIPEKARRFMNYFHDLHDIKFMYEEHGLPVPKHVMAEVERCDDRYRHILDDLKGDGGVLDKVRRDMAQRQGNRWDHSRLLPKTEKYE